MSSRAIAAATGIGKECRESLPMSGVEFSDGAPLGQAREWLRGQATSHGARCPCCQQFTKVYRRSINAGMAHALVTMFREAGTDWLHVPTVVGGRSREEGKLRYWGLVEEERQLRPDGGRSGWWRVTARGSAFVCRGLRVPKYALVYDGQPLRLDGAPVTISDCLGAKFNLAELLGAETDVASRSA